MQKKQVEGSSYRSFIDQFRELAANLKEKKAPKILVFFGADDYLNHKSQTAYVSMLVRAGLADKSSVVDSVTEGTYDTFFQSSLFGGKEIKILPWNDGLQWESLMRSPFYFLTTTSKDPLTTKSKISAFKKKHPEAIQVIEVGVPVGVDIDQYVKTAFAKKKLQAPETLLRWLKDSFNGAFFAIDQAIEAYDLAYGQKSPQVDLELFRPLIMQSLPEQKMFALRTSLFEESLTKSEDIFESCLQAGESPLGIISFLSKFISQCIFLIEGEMKEPAFAALGITAWQRKKFVDYCRKRSLKDLKQAMSLTLEIESRLKSSRSEVRNLFFPLWTLLIR